MPFGKAVARDGRRPEAAGREAARGGRDTIGQARAEPILGRATAVDGAVLAEVPAKKPIAAGRCHNGAAHGQRGCQHFETQAAISGVRFPEVRRKTAVPEWPQNRLLLARRESRLRAS